jgi:hypothetical protein
MERVLFIFLGKGRVFSYPSLREAQALPLSLRKAALMPYF